MASPRISLARVLELGVCVSWREALAIVYEAVAKAGATEGAEPATVTAESCLLTRGGDVVLAGTAAQARPEAVVRLLDDLLASCSNPGRFAGAVANGTALDMIEELSHDTTAKRRRVEVALVAIRGLAAEADAARAIADAEEQRPTADFDDFIAASSAIPTIPDQTFALLGDSAFSDGEIRRPGLDHEDLIAAVEAAPTPAASTIPDQTFALLGDSAFGDAEIRRPGRDHEDLIAAVEAAPTPAAAPTAWPRRSITPLAPLSARAAPDMASPRISLARVLELGVRVSGREAAVHEALAGTGATEGAGPAPVTAESCVLTRGGDAVLAGTAAQARPEAVVRRLDDLLASCSNPGRFAGAVANGTALELIEELSQHTMPEHRRVEVASVALRGLAAKAEAARAMAEAAARTMAGADAARAMAEADARAMAEAAARTMAEADAARAMAEADARAMAEAAARTMAETDAARAMAEADARTMAEAAARTMAEADATRAMAEADAARAMAEADAARAMAKADAARAMAEADAARTMAEAAARTMAEADATRAMAEADAARAMAEADAARAMAEADAARAMAEADAARAMAKADAARAMAEADAARTMAWAAARTMVEADAARAMAEADARTMAEAAARTMAKADAARAMAEADARTMAEAAARTMAETDAARAMAEADARTMAEAAARTMAEADAAHTMAEAAARTMAEADAARAMAEADARTMAEAAARTMAEADAARAMAEADARTMAEAAARTMAEADAARAMAEADARAMAEAAARTMAEADAARAMAEADARAMAEAAARTMAEADAARAMAEADARTMAEADEQDLCDFDDCIAAPTPAASPTGLPWPSGTAFAPPSAIPMLDDQTVARLEDSAVGDAEVRRPGLDEVASVTLHELVAAANAAADAAREWTAPEDAVAALAIGTSPAQGTRPSVRLRSAWFSMDLPRAKPLVNAVWTYVRGGYPSAIPMLDDQTVAPLEDSAVGDAEVRRPGLDEVASVTLREPVAAADAAREWTAPEDAVAALAIGTSPAQGTRPSVRLRPAWFSMDLPSVRLRPAWFSMDLPSVRLRPAWFSMDLPSVRLRPAWFSMDLPSAKRLVNAVWTYVRGGYPSAFDRLKRASPVALVCSVLAVAAGGILGLQLPDETRRSAVEPSEPAIEPPEFGAPVGLDGQTPPARPAPALLREAADPPSVPPLVARSAPRGSPRIEGPKAPFTEVPDSYVWRPARRPETPAKNTATEVPDSYVWSMPQPARRPETPAQNTATVAGSRSLSTTSAAAALLAPGAANSAGAPPPAVDPSSVVASPGATASSPAQTLGSASNNVPINATARSQDRELEAIENVLGRYRIAFNTLDAGAALAVWPTVNEKTLANAFERLESQDMSFSSCQIEIISVIAEAACSGSARHVPKVGSRTPRTEARRWKFMLRKARGGWLIESVDAR